MAKKAGKGRPTAFSEKTREIIKLLARRGFTDKEMAVCLDITEQTLNNWKLKHKDFFESLNDWKHLPDSEIERSLFERAKGYSHPEDKIFVNNGETIIVPTMKHYPPDTTACIFWLKNRRPDEWRDKKDIDLPEDSNITINLIGYGQKKKGNNNPA